MSQALPSGQQPLDPSVERVCSRTGLLLRPAAEQLVWRVAKTSYGGLRPPLRDVGDDRRHWGRYDVVGHRTAYGASPRAACFAESLAAQRVGLGPAVPKWQDLFDDPPIPGVTSLLGAAQAEWATWNHLRPGAIARGWRDERLVYQLRLPAAGWFVDIERSESVSAIGEALGQELRQLGLSNLTVGVLRAEERNVTTTVASWIWRQVLDDGSYPHGIRFGSKYNSTWACWAIWLRAVDDGKSLAHEPTKGDMGTEIKDCQHDPDLASVAQLFGLRCF